MFRFQPKKLTLEERGLKRVLGPLELRILEYLWKEGQGTSREICEALCKKGWISFNAVSTVLGRLVRKGILARQKSKSYFVYVPVAERKAFMRQVSHAVLSSLLRDKELFSPHALFAAMEDLTPAERRRARELIKKAKV